MPDGDFCSGMNLGTAVAAFAEHHHEPCVRFTAVGVAWWGRRSDG